MLPAQADHLDDIKDKLNKATSQNSYLKKDLISAQRIQIEQSKALEKITNENEFPIRMKGLIDELRVEKDKNTKHKE